MATDPGEIKRLVEELWAATEALSTAENGLRSAVFQKLLDRELASSAERQDSNGRSRGESVAAAVDRAFTDADDRAEAIATYFDIESHEAEDLFDLRDPDPKIHFANDKLSEGIKGGLREITLLVCGARSALGLETTTQQVRDAANQFDRADSNFMKNLSDFDEIAIRGKPKSKNRAIRMRVIGSERAAKLAQRIAGAAE